MATRYFLVCSCKAYERTGRPCTHCWKVLRRPPRSTDVCVRWLKEYLYFYKKVDAITKLLEDLLENEMPGPEVDNEAELLDVGSGDEELAFFEHCLPDADPKLISGNYWAAEQQRGGSGIQSTKNGLGEEVKGLAGARRAMIAMSQEVALSQSLQLSQLGGQSGDDESDFPPGNDNELSSDEEDEAINRSPGTVNYHSFCNQYVRDMVKHAESSAAAALVLKRDLPKLFESVLKAAHDEQILKKGSPLNSKEGFLSLDSSKNAARLKPVYSPSRNRGPSKRVDNKRTPNRKNSTN